MLNSWNSVLRYPKMEMQRHKCHAFLYRYLCSSLILKQALTRINGPSLPDQGGREVKWRIICAWLMEPEALQEFVPNPTYPDDLIQ